MRCGAIRSRLRRSRHSRTSSPFTGTAWMPGTRRTKKFSCTRAILISASMCSTRRARCRSSSEAKSWPRPAARGSCSRRGCRPAITSRPRTCGWTFWFRARPSPAALIKARPGTTRSRSGTRCSAISSGVIPTRSRNAPRSRAICASSTSRSTRSEWTASRCRGR